MPQPDLSLRRVVSPALLEALLGPLSDVLAWRAAEPSLRDVQLRREPKGRRSWASLYLGLTSVLDIDERGAVAHPEGRFRLRAHPTHRKRGHFRPEWGRWMTLHDLVGHWPDVQQYLRRLRHRVDAQWTDTEGLVHALLADCAPAGVAVVNREASLSFRDQAYKDLLLGGWRAQVLQVLEAADDGQAWWGHVRAPGFGTSPDVLALDDEGRVLVVEAKPAEALAGIARAPAQVWVYAAMYATWLREDGGAANELEGELAQRVALGLTPPDLVPALGPRPPVVPVLALGPGPLSPSAAARLRDVARAVAPLHEAAGVSGLEVWQLFPDGSRQVWDWTDDGAPLASSPPLPSTFVQRATAAAVAWKRTALPPQARGKGRYAGLATSPLRDVCLPEGQHLLNLLPEAAHATEVFTALGAHWHRPVAGGPTNHLLSSQVQCVNALLPLETEPRLLARAFGHVLAIARVLPLVGQDRHLAFEFGGARDYLEEGSGRTLADAAFRFEDHDGRVQLALVEWKYIEDYRGSSSADTDHYDRFAAREDSVLHQGADAPLPVRDFLVEPFYQLLRQQLLAQEMQRSGEQEADVVRVVHVSHGGNEGYHQSLTAAHRAVGDRVHDVWQAALRAPGRFDAVDSRRFCDPTVGLTGPGYRARYGHD